MDNRRGDDLDDDFVPDDLVALSGEEDDDFPSAEDSRNFLSAEENDQMRSGSALGPTGDDKKRKRREKDKQRKAKVSFLIFPAY
jgi:protein CMS1